MMKFLLLIYSLFFSMAIPAQVSVTSASGTASYYAGKFEGRRCSSGEVFRQDSLTAAHKTLPFGTMVKVTNLNNDSTVIVKINDRLPKKSKRIIDLTKRAAKQLNFIQQGITKVKLQVISDKD